MPEIGFLIPYYILFEIFLPGSRMNGIRVYNFSLSFSAYLIPFWLKIMSERGFLVFLIFLHFFWNFLARVECERNSWLKFISLFLSLYYPVLAKNNAGKGFFNFLNFLTFFFRNFLARVAYERNSGINFFFSLSCPRPTCFE